MKTLTPAQIAKVQETLAHAREGRATLMQLAEAETLANGASLNGCLGEIRAHMRSMIPAPPMRAEAKGLLLGIVSGILTHYLLNSLHRNHEECCPSKSSNHRAARMPREASGTFGGSMESEKGRR